MVRKQEPKERYYHVYSKNATAAAGVVIKVKKSGGIECMTKGLSIESIRNDCKLEIENGKLISQNKDYIATEISINRAARKIEDSKYRFSMQNWND